MINAITHILIQRAQALPNPNDRYPLKALLAYDAITHPEHPLRGEGEAGARFFIGGRHFDENYLAYCDI